MAHLACRQGLAPLMYHTVHRIGVASQLPRVALEVLRDAYYANAASTMLLYHELHTILRTLQATGSKVIVLKGAALAETVYPDRALRPMSDVDLLVSEEDVARVEGTFAAMGYQPRQHTDKEWITKYCYHTCFVKNGATSREMHCEVHWRLERPSRPFTIDLQGLWARAVPATIANVETLVFAPEDFVLYLCLHVCKHRLAFYGLRALCDIAAILRLYGPQMDWSQVQVRASRWHIAPYVYLALRLATEWVGASVPEPVLDALAPADFDVRLLEWARERMQANTPPSFTFPNLNRWWHNRRFPERVAVLRETFSPAVMEKNYGVAPTSRKRHFYYPLRLKDLLSEYGPLLWRLVWRDQELTTRLAHEHRAAQLDAWFAAGQEVTGHAPDNNT